MSAILSTLKIVNVIYLYLLLGTIALSVIQTKNISFQLESSTIGISNPIKVSFRPELLYFQGLYHWQCFFYSLHDVMMFKVFCRLKVHEWCNV